MKILQIATIKFFIAAAYIAIFCVSGMLTIGLWESTANQNLSIQTAQAIGASLHISLYLFAAAARGLPLSKPIKITTWLIVAVLGITSIAATIGQLESSTQTGTLTANQARIELQLANTKRITHASNGSTFSQYEKATKSELALNKIDNIDTESLLQKAKQTNNMSEMINLITSTLNLNEQSARLTAFATLGALLDICGIWAALLLFQPVPLRNSSHTSRNTETQTTAPPLEQARTNITKKQLGDRTSISTLAAELNISRTSASRILNQLTSEGIVEKDTKGFKRATQQGATE